MSDKLDERALGGEPEGDQEGVDDLDYEWTRDLPPGVKVRDWEDRFARRFKRLRAQAGIPENYDETRTIQNLRRETLVTLETVLKTAVEVGDPEYLLKVLRQSGRLAGLEGPNVAISIGSSDALPDLSHVSDEELARLVTTTGTALEALPERSPLEPESKPVVAEARSRRRRQTDDDDQ